MKNWLILNALQTITKSKTVCEVFSFLMIALC